MEIEKVIKKYFRNERMFYYHPHDRIVNGHFLRYRDLRAGTAILSVGSNDGEVELGVYDAEKLESVIKMLIF